VLDASVVLAHINGEPGADAIGQLAEDALISAVNLAEVYTKLAEHGLSTTDARLIIDRYAFEIVPFDEALARQTGAMRSTTRRLGLSLGDRACLALAQREALPALTADRSWSKLNLGVDVRIVR
jgi:ribonuclease VapC